MLHRIGLTRLSRVQSPEDRDVASVVDARQQRYRWFDPGWRRRDDSRCHAVHVCDAQPELFEHEELDRVGGLHG